MSKTQKEIARMVGCSDVYISQVINGKKKCSKRIAAIIEQETGKPVPIVMNMREENAVLREELELTVAWLQDIEGHVADILGVPSAINSINKALGRGE